MSGFDFVTRANADYVEEQYRRYRADPTSVDERWALFFAGFDLASDGNGGGSPRAAADSTPEPAGPQAGGPPPARARGVRLRRGRHGARDRVRELSWLRTGDVA